MLHSIRAQWAIRPLPKITSTTLRPLNSSTRAYSSPSSKTHTRPSSSAQPDSPATVPSTSSTSTTSPDDINPPPSTRPAEINAPDSLPDDAAPIDTVKRYVALGRAYLSFYKTGLKNVYHNYRTSLPMRKGLGLPVYLPVSPPPKSKTIAFKNAVEKTGLSRSNFQLIRRAAYDVRRMIPFTLMLIVCGEFTPVIVLALGSAVVPYTCRVPKQLTKDRTQKASRKRAALVAHYVQSTGSVSYTPDTGKELDLLAQYISLEWIDSASPEEVLRACAVFGLVKTHTRPSTLVSLIYRARLRRFAEYLAVDDGLIMHGGGVSAMEGVEVRIAVEERGGVEIVMRETGEDESEEWEGEREQRRWLEGWLERRA
ncbi:uncharacterized protein EURHEDRAFT_411424 [Aspergillus ruber CBS 135680]|uniref:Letm1 RBD domain-containing protein n=1 Tax=Aspergillus ruber (strain CBS 135680) TaxID=1388766 RepID=A0A017SIY1_ASPRC|nr:uncharacterized protein EURHEDRAFT_411424 [Aspergillus ruber CBS 135680]EYE96270.1 hypothetical protein EURHEDRAFT_411424 [Aspergillus ruber CBS 135680]